jgi:hypothetical protein
MAKEVTAEPFGLAQLRAKRRDAILRTLAAARMTVRAQRSDLARIAREWVAISKRINAALARYERSVEDLGLPAPEALAPRDLIECLKGCVADEQQTKLDEIEIELRTHEKEIRAAGRKRGKKRMLQMKLRGVKS